MSDIQLYAYAFYGSMGLVTFGYLGYHYYTKAKKESKEANRKMATFNRR